jgi:hypothetical protein
MGPSCLYCVLYSIFLTVRIIITSQQTPFNKQPEGGTTIVNASTISGSRERKRSLICRYLKPDGIYIYLPTRAIDHLQYPSRRYWSATSDFKGLPPQSFPNYCTRGASKYKYVRSYCTVCTVCTCARGARATVSLLLHLGIPELFSLEDWTSGSPSGNIQTRSLLNLLY